MSAQFWSTHHLFGLLIPLRTQMLLRESNAALPNLFTIFDHSLILLASLVSICSLSMFVEIILSSSLASASSMDSLISIILHSFLPAWTMSLVVIHNLSSNLLFAWTLANFLFFLAPSTPGTICLLVPSLQVLCTLSNLSWSIHQSLNLF